MSTDNYKNMTISVLGFSIGVCAYFTWKVLWSDKEKSQREGPQTKNFREASKSSSLDDEKNSESVVCTARQFDLEKSIDLSLQTELLTADINFNTGQKLCDAEPVLADKYDDFTISKFFEKQDSRSSALEPDSWTSGDIFAPMVKYESCIADLFEVPEAQELGHFIGVAPIDVCWLRGDDGNTLTDYFETMPINWQRLEEINGVKTSFEVPQIRSNELRDLKSKLAVALIDAMPTSRRNISLLSFGVDKIWRAVTEFKRGEVRVDMVMFNKELSWLKSKKKRQQITLRQYNSLLSSVEDTISSHLSSVSLDFGEGRCSRLEISPCQTIGREPS